MLSGMGKTMFMGIALLAACLLLQCEEAHGTEYVVGGAKKWSPEANVQAWAQGKTFKVGDVLIFQYSNPKYGLVSLTDEDYYRRCDAYPAQHRGYLTGNDHVVLTERGVTFFMAGLPEYCQKGLKIKVVVT